MTFTATGSGSTIGGVPSPSSAYQYRFQLWNGTSYAVVQPYGPSNQWTMTTTSVPGTYRVDVEVRTTPYVTNDTFTRLYFDVQ